MNDKSIYKNNIFDIVQENDKEGFGYQSTSSLIEGLSFANNAYYPSQSVRKDEFNYVGNNDLVAYTEVEKLIKKRNALDEEKEKNELVSRLVLELEKTLYYFDIENSEISSVEDKIIEIEQNYKMRILGEVLTYIYIKHYDNPQYLVGICKALLRYDLNEVNPWGITIISGLLNHPSELVMEYTVQLIDNWHSVEMLPILKTILVNSDWMKAYIDDVVKSLERDNVLYQKAI